MKKIFNEKRLLSFGFLGDIVGPESTGSSPESPELPESEKSKELQLEKDEQKASANEFEESLETIMYFEEDFAYLNNLKDQYPENIIAVDEVKYRFAEKNDNDVRADIEAYRSSAKAAGIDLEEGQSNIVEFYHPYNRIKGAQPVYQYVDGFFHCLNYGFPPMTRKMFENKLIANPLFFSDEKKDIKRYNKKIEEETTKFDISDEVKSRLEEYGVSIDETHITTSDGTEFYFQSKKKPYDPYDIVLNEVPLDNQVVLRGVSSYLTANNTVIVEATISYQEHDDEAYWTETTVYVVREDGTLSSLDLDYSAFL